MAVSGRKWAERSLVVAICAAVVGGSATGSIARAEPHTGAYLAARQAVILGDYPVAADYFTRALTRDPSNPMLLENAVLSYLSLGDLDRALPIAQKMEADGLQSQVASMVLSAAEARAGAFDALLTRMAEDRGTGPLVDGLTVAWAQMGKGDVSAALEIFDKLTEESGLGPFAGYHKALALAMVGDFEGAEALFAAEVGGPLQLTRRAAIARVQILSQLDRDAEAVALLDQMFGTDLDPALAQMRAALAEDAVLPFNMITSPIDGIAEVYHTVASFLRREAGDEYTLLYSRIVSYLRPDHTDAILQSASLLESMEKFELAVATYKQVPSDDPSFHAAELGRAEALRKLGKLDAASEVLEQLTRSHGDLPIVHVTLGDLMRQMERFGDAVTAYDKALSLYPSEEQNQWFIYYARAIAQERQDVWDKAEADFRKALELNPDQPQVLNYLGYSLVEKQVKLDEALDMIERAVAARPDSGYIVDSLGWVLYRLGRYDEAIVHMERAAELMPVDPIVNDHLGDVLWAVGRYREAEFQWTRALSFDPEEKDATRIRRKLEVGLDVVLAEEGAQPLARVANGN
jgi:tetratricopeptide (TPR) repeat protein